VVRELVGGPFAGVKLEIDESAKSTAPVTVGDWSGMYQAQEGLASWKWEGTTGAVLVNTHGTSTAGKATPEVTGNGFDLFRDLLGELGEDPTEREEITTTRINGTFKPGHVDDFGDSYTPLGRGAWAIYPANTPKFQKKNMEVTPAHGTGKNTPDDFGALFGITDRPEYVAGWLRIVRRARYTIGRTTYTIPATAESVNRLRAKVLKIKKWFADKHLNQARPKCTPIAAPDAKPEQLEPSLLSIVAEQEAQRKEQEAQSIEDAPGAADFELARAARARREAEALRTIADTAPAVTRDEPVTVDCAGAQVDAYIAALAAHEVGDMSEAIAAIEQAQGEAPAELATVCEADHAQGAGSVGSVGFANSGPTPQIEVRSPQSDHEAARASVAKRHTEQASEAAGAGGWEYAIGETYTGGIEAAVFKANQRGDGFEYRVGDDAIMERKPSTKTPPKNPSGFAQQARSNIGAWCAALYRDQQGAHVLRFDVPHLAPHFSTYETRAELMASLQASGEQADREILSRFSALDSSGEEVRSMSPKFFKALNAHLENINYHTESLMLDCWRAGRDDLATGLMHLAKYQAAPGYTGIGWEMSEARSAISEALRTGAADHVSPEAQAILTAWGLNLWGENPDVNEPPTGGGEVAHSIFESTPGFSKVTPFTLDPRELLTAGLTAEKLVGLGVFYLGNAANASGEGAITEATDTLGKSFGGLNMVCTLEDGRIIKATPNSFTGELRPIFKFNGKMHGAPYLAQLAAVSASLKAQQSSAHAMAQAEHARQLETLAAEFPQLERKGQNDGGKLVAINIRKLLKSAFKGVKFSVTSDYNACRVGWSDGPTVDQVEAVIGRFDIGHSDTQSDYFYTSETAFSKLFGGVQYLITKRDHTDPLITKAIDEAFHGGTVPPDATPKDWRSASGAFEWHTDGGQMYSRRVREILSNTPG
jgi:hypothetical protein